jgi:hypothetical protein
MAAEYCRIAIRLAIRLVAVSAMKTSGMIWRRRKVQGSYGSWLPFLLELCAAAWKLPLGFRHGELSPGDGTFTDLHFVCQIHHHPRHL